jgi:hypothetical protein
MTGVYTRTSLAALAAACSLAPASAQGPIATQTRGSYTCELPGDAAGQAGVPQPQADFTIESASRYSSPQGGGTYLRRGGTLVMTSGPRQGESYAVLSDAFLRRIENGKPGALRCVLGGR